MIAHPFQRKMGVFFVRICQRTTFFGTPLSLTADGFLCLSDCLALGRSVTHTSFTTPKVRN